MTPSALTERAQAALDRGDTTEALRWTKALHAINLKAQQMRGLGPNRLRVVR